MVNHFTKIKPCFFKGILMLLLILIVSGCENLNDPGPSEFNNSLLFNLVVNSQSQSLYIYRTVQLSELADRQYHFFNSWSDVYDKGFDRLFIEDAEIFLTDEKNDRIKFTAITDSVYKNKFVSPVDFIPEQLKEYVLNVKAAGQQFTGRTITPGDFNILAPDDGHTYKTTDHSFDIDILWSPSRGAAGYIVKIIPLIKSESHWDYTIFSDVKSNSSFHLQYDLNKYGFFDSCRVEIHAYDKNYYDHVHGKKDCAGLSGAYGFFGSSVLKSIKIKFEKHHP